MAIEVTRHLRSVIKDEKKILRTELQGLKNCQIQFLTGAVVSVSIIVGLPGIFSSRNNQDFIQSAYLVPLVVLIPCWWGFFDKAKTITRIVGYVRILEELSLVKAHGTAQNINRFIGWENSVSVFRSEERKGNLRKIPFRDDRPNLNEVMESIFLIPSQRYWSLAHYTYAILSALCLIISFLGIWGTSGHFPSKVALGIALCVFSYSLVWNSVILWTLMWGRHSYAATAAYWRHILGHQ